MELQYEIGLTFQYYAKKHNNQYEIIDIYTTRNHFDDIIKIEYVTEHDFMGQKVKDFLSASAIARSLA